MRLLSKRADRASDKEFSKDDLKRDYNILTQFGTLGPKVTYMYTVQWADTELSPSTI